MADPQVVFLLWHGDDVNEEAPDPKLLGVYSSEEAARDRIARSAAVPGFVKYPDDFLISPYSVDKDQWLEGFMEVG
jgi:hypothetical protein